MCAASPSPAVRICACRRFASKVFENVSVNRFYFLQTLRKNKSAEKRICDTLTWCERIREPGQGRSQSEEMHITSSKPCFPPQNKISLSAAGPRCKLINSPCPTMSLFFLFQSLSCLLCPLKKKKKERDFLRARGKELLCCVWTCCLFDLTGRICLWGRQRKRKGQKVKRMSFFFFR